MNLPDVRSATGDMPYFAEVVVSRKLRELRRQQGLSLRALAERSGLNVNTLSLVEKGKTSPSVSTLQQLAHALQVPVAVFFEEEVVEKRAVFTPAEEGPLVRIGKTRMEDLGRDLSGGAVQPYAVTLEPGCGSGEIVHTGYEFVYCLGGEIHYRIEPEKYVLQAGDSLMFAAHLPHSWENQGTEPAQILLVLCPADQRDEPLRRHFSRKQMDKEINMKIALITDDGKTISQHFGRAPYYVVLTIEEGKVVNREMRDKMGHTHFVNQAHAEEPHGAGHGMDSASHNKHVSMAEAIADCQYLLCGGMGMGAYESMRRLNIQPVVTEQRDVDAAAQAFIDGKLVDHTELLH